MMNNPLSDVREALETDISYLTEIRQMIDNGDYENALFWLEDYNSVDAPEKSHHWAEVRLKDYMRNDNNE